MIATTFGSEHVRELPCVGRQPTAGASTSWRGDDVPCAAGKKVLGGGVTTSGADQFVNESFPSSGTGTGASGNAGWAATIENVGPTDESFTVYAVCANG